MSRSFLATISVSILLVVCPVCFGLGFYFGNNIGTYYTARGDANATDEIIRDNSEVLLFALERDWRVPAGKRDRYLIQLRQNMNMLESSNFLNLENQFLDRATIEKNGEIVVAIERGLERAQDRHLSRDSPVSDAVEN